MISPSLRNQTGVNSRQAAVLMKSNCLLSIYHYFSTFAALTCLPLHLLATHVHAKCCSHFSNRTEDAWLLSTREREAN